MLSRNNVLSITQIGSKKQEELMRKLNKKKIRKTNSDDKKAMDRIRKPRKSNRTLQLQKTTQ